MPFENEINRIAKNFSQIKLKGGIFAKTLTAIIFITICITVLGLAARNLYVLSGAIISIFILAFVTLYRLVNFANKNPQAAILEGAEFVKHEEIQLAAKGLPSISRADKNLVEESPINEAEIADVDKPDEAL